MLSPFSKIHDYSKLNPSHLAVNLTDSWHFHTLWNLFTQSRIRCREWWGFRLFVDRNGTCWKWVWSLQPQRVLTWCLIQFRPSRKDTEVIIKGIELDSTIYAVSSMQLKEMELRNRRHPFKTQIYPMSVSSLRSKINCHAIRDM